MYPTLFSDFVQVENISWNSMKITVFLRGRTLCVKQQQGLHWNYVSIFDRKLTYSVRATHQGSAPIAFTVIVVYSGGGGSTVDTLKRTNTHTHIHKTCGMKESESRPTRTSVERAKQKDKKVKGKRERSEANK